MLISRFITKKEQRHNLTNGLVLNKSEANIKLNLIYGIFYFQANDKISHGSEYTFRL